MFKPSQHGWPFASDLIVTGGTLGVGPAAHPRLGLGGGLCRAVLDRYLDGVGIPRNTPAPAPGDPLHEELVRRQVAALDGVWTRVRDWQTRPDGSWRDRLPFLLPFPLPGPDLASLARAEWPGLRRRLDAGEPVLLTVIEPADEYTSGTAAWQALAYGYTREGPVVTLAIYDPGRPDDDEVRLRFALRGELDARLTGGHRIRGFFTIEYDRAPASGLRAETFADRSVLALNRKVHGRPSCTARGGRLDLLARDGDGALLHFWREGVSHWLCANVTEPQESSAFQLYDDPVALDVAGRLHVFSRSYVGDLLHFRGRKRWRAANRTEHRRTGPRFRLEGRPVPVSAGRGRISVLGRGKEGALIHYSGWALAGWTAEEVPAPRGARIVDDPVAVHDGAALHVVARTRDGRVLHWSRDGNAWVSTEATAGQEPEAKFRFAGRPVLLADGGALHVFGRGTDDGLLHLERDGDGRWKGRALSARISGDPAVTRGPAGIHAFAVAAGGGLTHAWQDGRWRGREWRVEEVLSTRPALDPALAPRDPVLAWGSRRELRVFAGHGAEWVAYVWRRDRDWSAWPVSARAGVGARHLPGEAPALVEDGEGRPHLFATDGRGTVVHLEPGPWIEPVPSESWPRAAGAAGRARAAAGSAAAGTAAPGTPSADGATAADPAAEPAAAGERATFEWDVPVPEPAAPWEPGASQATGMKEAEPGAGETTSPESSPDPLPDVEPLDLELLDTWPPPPPSLRGPGRGRDRKRAQPG